MGEKRMEKQREKQVCQNAPLLELRDLLENFRKSLKFWFQIKASQELINTCVEIMMHGLIHVDSSNESQENNVALCKFMDELDWVRKSSHIKDFDFVECAEESMMASQMPIITLHNFMQNWVLCNLEDKTMCASIEALIITEKELLQTNYHEKAFLRNEPYAHAFIIGLSAFELNQYSLLSQIDKNLYTKSITFVGNDIEDNTKQTKHKRTSSHPNFSLSLSKTNVPLKPDAIPTTEKTNPTDVHEQPKSTTVLPAFRKTKSLPIISLPAAETAALHFLASRPRSKTINMIQWRSLPKTIPTPSSPQNSNDFTDSKSHLKSINGIKLPEDQPSTSVNSCYSRISNSSSNAVCSTDSPASTSSSLSETSLKKGQRIEIINCDDIKIWTDQSQSPQLTQSSMEREHSDSIALPSPVAIKKTKNVSPINSFLSSLFGTPTYSTWYTGDDQTEQATAAVIGENPSTFCNTGSVFDAFMPVYGKKVQLKQKTNLFEDGISTLDYRSPTSSRLENASQNTPKKSDESIEEDNTIQRTPASSQSLTAFLQMSGNSRNSRNNTDLEKENAHFRISEAIISAIEHIKWANSQPDVCRKRSEPVVATDWLENERKHAGTEENSLETHQQREETILADSNEYIPFVEQSENCLESLSAEVVGLSLISKFKDKHMPKVSELKWLVSDEDTPQQLLPMPGSSSSTNVDEHTFPPMTRGTKYWAPPRPQIIFTDHPTPNRKEIIHKQKNRCAGCGMRVSPQTINSYRYCTYFGKYHCTGCHRNQMSATPAKILQMWDFKCYPVSVFAYRLIEEMFSYPLFHVPDLNPALYIKSKSLLQARNKRLQLKYIKDFIRACRFAKREQNYFDTIPDYITNEIDTWSMSDFVEARNESMQRSINELIEKCENHILHCVLCTGRGFCCEYCLREHVIYPWENKVFRCDRCGSCFHLKCWKSMQEVCCRCQRIWNRKNEVDELMSEK